MHALNLNLTKQALLAHISTVSWKPIENRGSLFGLLCTYFITNSYNYMYSYYIIKNINRSVNPYIKSMAVMGYKKVKIQ